MTENDRKSLYQSASTLPVWRDILLDLIAFAKETSDVEHSLGRYEMVAYILESALSKPEPEGDE
jgi:hypothetical protein